MTSNPQAIDSTAHQQLADEGFVILKNVVRQSSIIRLRRDIERIVSSHGLEGESVFDTIKRLDREDKATLYRIYQFITKTFTSLDAIRLDLMPLLEELLPEGTILDLGSAVIFAIPDDDRLTWQWHQEGPYDPNVPNILSVNMPVFEAATIENGTISLLKGSHKLGALPYKKEQAATDASTSLIPENIDQLAEEYEQTHFLAEPGDIILFYEHLVHRSNRNRSSNPRVTFVGRFTSIDKLPEHATIIDGKPY